MVKWNQNETVKFPRHQANRPEAKRVFKPWKQFSSESSKHIGNFLNIVKAILNDSLKQTIWTIYFALITPSSYKTEARSRKLSINLGLVCLVGPLQEEHRGVWIIRSTNRDSQWIGREKGRRRRRIQLRCWVVHIINISKGKVISNNIVSSEVSVLSSILEATTLAQ